MTELKPCPFCGGKAHIRRIKDFYSVCCTECGCKGAKAFIQDWHRDKFIAQGNAIKLWNKRYSPKEIPLKPLPEERYFGNGKCPTCGVVFMDKSTKYCGNCGQKLDWSDDK